MVSSLAAQLARGASANAALLNRRKKQTESYLFSGRDADEHDLDAIHGLAFNGFLQLCELDPRFEEFEEGLFSETARNTDRTLENKEFNSKLDEFLGRFLSLLGSRMLEAPAGKVIEWLVRRFRINQFNVHALVLAFLPYYDSPHFTKMLTILHIEQGSMWFFLTPFKAAAKPLQRSVLVAEMRRSQDLVRYIAQLVPESLGLGTCYETMLTFNVSIMLEYLNQEKKINEGVMAILIPSFLRPLAGECPTNALLGSYLLLAAISQDRQLAKPALTLILKSLIKTGHQTGSDRLVPTLIAICAKQDNIAPMKASTVRSLIELPNAPSCLKQSMNLVGVDRLVITLLPALMQADSGSREYEALEELIAHSSTPTSITSRIAEDLVNAVQESSSLTIPQEHIFQQLYQRYPGVLQAVINRLPAGPHKEAVENVLLNSAMMSTGIGSTPQTLVGASSSEASVRTASVRRLITQLNETSESSEIDLIRGALHQRLHDSEVSVIEALYSNPHAIMPIFSGLQFESSLAELLSDPALPRAGVRLHVQYACNNLQPEHVAGIGGVLFPLLLLTKPRSKTSLATWGLLASAKKPMAGILKGCGTLWSNKAEWTLEDMTMFNLGLVNKLAENILSSNDFEKLSNFLISKLDDANPQSRVLGTIVMQHLLSISSGEHRIALGRAVLDRLGEGTTVNDEPEASDTSPEPFSDEAVMTLLVQKPNSKNSASRAHWKLVSTLASAPQPVGTAVDWMQHRPSPIQDDRADTYIEFLRDVYAYAVVRRCPLYIFSRTFETLGKDALLFLCGIFTKPGSDETSVYVRLSTIYNAAAFITASIGTLSQDYQVVIPSVLVVLQDPDSRVRQAATACLLALQESITASTPSSVHGFDSLYGSNTKIVEYLDFPDVSAYVAALISGMEQIRNDPGYIVPLHAEILGRLKADNKKNNARKRRILSYLLSHVVAWDSSYPRSRLLHCLRGTSDEAKATAAASIRSHWNPDSSLSSETAELQLWSEIWGCFDLSSAKALNTESSNTWPIFIDIVSKSATNYFPSDVSSMILTSLRSATFEKMSIERQQELCLVLLDLGTGSPQLTPIKLALQAFISDVELLELLLATCFRVDERRDDRGPKRQRLEDQGSEGIAQVSSNRLTLLLEVLTSTAVPYRSTLLSTLINAIDSLDSSGRDAATDFRYLQQLLLTVADQVAMNLIDKQQLTGLTIRMEILVAVMRSTDNPQTLHQTLLLVATLARLAPQSVLQHIMPVFTFMGSNVLHRDDAYSFKVVQKTVESIVPVMVDHLRSTRTPSELPSAAKEFLHIFTDAATHIPRHRRSRFFIHLMDTLGPQDFLAPLLMLLVEKVSNKAVRQKGDDLKASFSLPTNLLLHYAMEMQLSVVSVVVKESLDLFRAKGQLPEGSTPVSRDGTLGDKQYLALNIFVGHYFQERRRGLSSEEHTSGLREIADLLLHAATSVEDISDSPDSKLYHTATLRALQGILQSVSPSQVAQIVRNILKADTKAIQPLALSIMATKLTQMTREARDSVSPEVIEILSQARQIASRPESQALMTATIRLLGAVASSCVPGEEPEILMFLPILLSGAKSYQNMAEFLSKLPGLINCLGARLIPSLSEIVSVCCGALQALDLEGAHTDCATALGSLIRSMPSFLSSEDLTRIILVITNVENDAEKNHLSGLSKIITRKVPTASLLIALSQSWSDTKNGTSTLRPAQMERIALMLKRAIHNAEREIIAEHLRVLQRLFVELLGLRGISNVFEETVEEAIVAAFTEMVIKLNDASFKPVYRKLVDWAFASDESTAALVTSRRITVLNLTTHLFQLLKSLITPYTSLLLQSICDILRSYSTGTGKDAQLWISLTKLLTKSFEVDDGAFWRTDRLTTIEGPLVSQIPVIAHRQEEEQTFLSGCLCAMVSCASGDENVVQLIHRDVLLHTRSEDARVRLVALQSAIHLWESCGDSLIGFSPEASTYVAECAEDADDRVVRCAVQLQRAMTAVTG